MRLEPIIPEGGKRINDDMKQGSRFVGCTTAGNLG